jgi:hypothetical protein
MNKFILAMALAGVCATFLPGCGGSGENKTVGGEDKKAMEDYDAQVKESEEAMNANPPKM